MTSVAQHILQIKHLEQLRASAISEDVIQERGYRSTTGGAELLELGFSNEQARLSGLLIPLYSPLGGEPLWQLRPDEPRHEVKGNKVKIRKYELAPFSENRLDAHPRIRPHLKNVSIPLWITEGVKKADALISAGECAIALIGVWNFKGKSRDPSANGSSMLLADFDAIAFNGRTVYIAFDSDVMRKLPVQGALDRLTAILTQRGARVYHVYLPDKPDGSKQGVDDFLAASGTLDQLKALARSPGDGPRWGFAPLSLEDATFDLLLPTELQETEHVLVENLLCADDLALWVGHEKQRKSTLLLQFCVCLATGRDFLGFKIVEPVVVLYVDAESKTRDLVRRWEGIQKVLTAEERERVVENLKIVEGRKLVAQGLKLDLEAGTLQKILDAHRNAGLIVLDPLRVFYAGDEDKSAAVSDAMARLRLLAQGRALIVVHHARKRPGARREQLHLRDDPYAWSDNARGSNAWKAHADVIFLQELRDNEKLGEVLDFAVIARSFPNVAPMPLVSSEKTFAWHERLAEQDSLEAEGQLRERERELLNRIKGLLTEESCSRTGLVDRLVNEGVCKRAWAYRVIGRLLHAGLLIERPDGRVIAR